MMFEEIAAGAKFAPEVRSLSFEQPNRRHICGRTKARAAYARYDASYATRLAAPILRPLRSFVTVARLAAGGNLRNLM